VVLVNVKLGWTLVAEDEVKLYFNGNLLVESEIGVLFF
jgi:hypothetical protein